jgi:hypothetical protein
MSDVLASLGLAQDQKQPEQKPEVNKESTSAETEKPLTREEMIQTVNAALSSHLKRQKQPDLKSLVTEVLAEKAQSAPQPETKTRSKESDEVKTLRAEIDAMKAKERKAELALRAEKTTGTIKSALAAGNVKPAFLDMVTRDFLQTQVQFTEAGEAFTMQTDQYGGRVEVDIVTGINTFLQSNAGKELVQAPAAAEPRIASRAPLGVSAATNSSDPYAMIQAESARIQAAGGRGINF